MTIAAVMALGLAAATALAAPTAVPAVRQVAAIPLPGVEGRIDHMALDGTGQRLFVVALGNNTVEVLDLRAGRRTLSLHGFTEPQGVGFVASPRRLFVTSGGDGSCRMLDGQTFRVMRTLALGDDADNVRVDAAGHRVYVGFGGGGLATIDATSGNVIARVVLPAHPEAFELEPGGDRVFVNVPGSGEVAVVDRARDKVIGHWTWDGASSNFPMALDAAGGRLFLGCRRPAALVVLDAGSGKRLDTIPIDGDVDDVFYDAAERRLFASCGAGVLDVLDLPARGAPRVLDRLPTAAGARTCLYDASSHRLFVAVPHRGAQSAEIRIYQVAR